MITRKSLADEIDTYDQSIDDLNTGKKDCFKAYRDQLEAAGVAKVNIKLEIEAAKAAIRRRRLVVKDRNAVEEKDALVDEIFEEITASPRAPRVREENIEEFRQSVQPNAAVGGAPAESASDAISATCSQSQPSSSPAATAEIDPPPSVSTTPFQFKPVNLRPNCLNRENCAGSGSQHCHACKRAMAEREAA